MRTSREWLAEINRVALRVMQFHDELRTADLERLLSKLEDVVRVKARVLDDERVRIEVYYYGGSLSTVVRADRDELTALVRQDEARAQRFAEEARKQESLGSLASKGISYEDACSCPLCGEGYGYPLIAEWESWLAMTDAEPSGDADADA